MKTPAPKLTSAHPNSRADIDHFPRIYSRPLTCSATNVHAPESTLEHRVSRLARLFRSPWRHHRHRVLRNAARDSWRLPHEPHAYSIHVTPSHAQTRLDTPARGGQPQPRGSSAVAVVLDDPPVVPTSPPTSLADDVLSHSLAPPNRSSARSCATTSESSRLKGALA
jgi:hypothetical protein